MDFYSQAYRIYGGYVGAAGFGQFCRDCDTEITGLDPMFVDPDGNTDSDGHTRDCSTYLCKACGEARGYTAKEK